ncbi:hypothetical protein LINPERPRIM_LOCUS3855 [Linum perenne]
MRRFIMVGIHCVHIVAARPTITEALKMLEGDMIGSTSKLHDRRLPMSRESLALDSVDR